MVGAFGFRVSWHVSKNLVAGTQKWYHILRTYITKAISHIIISLFVCGWVRFIDLSAGWVQQYVLSCGLLSMNFITTVGLVAPRRELYSTH